MRLDHPELLARLADEFVVGTLVGAARRRFDRVCREDAAAMAAVRAAEDRLLPFSLTLTPVVPAAGTWDAINAKTGGPTQPRRTTRTSTRWSLGLAAVVAMTALGLGWFLWQRPPATQEIARVTTQEGASLWAVAVSTDGAQLDVVASNAVQPQSGRSFELWALPDGGAPVSLGLLPAAGEVSRELTAAQRAALQSASKVAVSLEPAGGSRTGAPTGPVLYVVPLERRG
jgi:anti-sigma-K factor RskA